MDQAGGHHRESAARGAQREGQPTGDEQVAGAVVARQRPGAHDPAQHREVVVQQRWDETRLGKPQQVAHDEGRHEWIDASSQHEVQRDRNGDEAAMPAIRHGR